MTHLDSQKNKLLSRSESDEERRQTTAENLCVFGIRLSNDRYRKDGRLKDGTVEWLEKLIPGFTIMRLISTELIGIAMIHEDIDKKLIHKRGVKIVRGRGPY